MTRKPRARHPRPDPKRNGRPSRPSRNQNEQPATWQTDLAAGAERTDNRYCEAKPDPAKREIFARAVKRAWEKTAPYNPMDDAKASVELFGPPKPGTLDARLSDLRQRERELAAADEQARSERQSNLHGDGLNRQEPAPQGRRGFGDLSGLSKYSTETAAPAPLERTPKQKPHPFSEEKVEDMAHRLKPDVLSDDPDDHPLTAARAAPAAPPPPAMRQRILDSKGLAVGAIAGLTFGAYVAYQTLWADSGWNAEPAQLTLKAPNTVPAPDAASRRAPDRAVRTKHQMRLAVAPQTPGSDPKTLPVPPKPRLQAQVVPRDPAVIAPKTLAAVVPPPAPQPSPAARPAPAAPVQTLPPPPAPAPQAKSAPAPKPAPAVKLQPAAPKLPVIKTTPTVKLKPAPQAAQPPAPAVEPPPIVQAAPASPPPPVVRHAARKAPPGGNTIIVPQSATREDLIPPHVPGRDTGPPLKLNPTARAPKPGLTTQPVPSDAVSAMIAQADGHMKDGDISAARLLFEHAARRGNALAAFKLGQAYDPIVIEQAEVYGVLPDAALAKKWYEFAVKRGHGRAGPALGKLKSYLTRVDQFQN
jgi:hypothetical protein